eukprot:2479505-Pyramimonas_sp.AAC.1
MPRLSRCPLLANTSATTASARHMAGYRSDAGTITMMVPSSAKVPSNNGTVVVGVGIRYYALHAIALVCRQAQG